MSSDTTSEQSRSFGPAPRGPAVSVRNLGKRYTLTANASAGGGTLAEKLLRTLRGGMGPSESFWAVRELSFDVYQGDVVGLIGHNGAGKSTLLKLLSRIAEPTEGEIRLYGRVGSLLEVGTGFHPELTGRENIFMNGAVLGMSRREISTRFDEIVDFFGYERFLDTPVKRYSSGMSVRLAFAVAANLSPEILIVDEVLAVGDAAFQKKCLGKMQDVAHSGRTVFFVSHNLSSVTALCTRGLLLEGGRLIADGPAAEVASLYQERVRAGTTDAGGSLERASRTGNGHARFTRLQVEAIDRIGATQPLIFTGGDVRLTATITADEPIADVHATAYIADRNTYRLTEASTLSGGRGLRLEPGESATVSFTLKRLQLAPGLYSIGLWLGRPDAEELDNIDFAGTLDIAVNPDTPDTAPRQSPYMCHAESHIHPGDQLAPDNFLVPDTKASASAQPIGRAA